MGLRRPCMRLIILLDKAKTIPSIFCEEAPNCPPKADSRVTRRGSSSDVLSHRGAPTGVSRGSVGHRARQPMEEETHRLSDLQLQPDAVSQLDRVTRDLRKDLETERNRCLELVDIVNRLGSYREEYRPKFAIAQLKNERENLSLRDELVETRQNLPRCSGKISEIQTQAESQQRDHKYLLEMLDHKGFLYLKKTRTGSAD
uniref:RxLR effector candidate protein n=1 Tax=Hyaloperonospora arabidopsidis (strain Emoy2) TaxID=559515 RepID=M4BDV7_HYAAE